MTKREATIKHRQFCNKVHKTYLNKNPDYTANNDDPFFAWRSGEHYKTHSVEQSFWWEITKKVGRIACYMSKIKYKVSNEGIIDTLLDLANTCIQLAVYIQGKKKDK